VKLTSGLPQFELWVLHDRPIQAPDTSMKQFQIFTAANRYPIATVGSKMRGGSIQPVRVLGQRFRWE